MIASLVPSQSHSEPSRQATRLAAIGANLGFDRLRQENREAWNDLWRGRINLVGAGHRWQSLADREAIANRRSVACSVGRYRRIDLGRVVFGIARRLDAAAHAAGCRLEQRSEPSGAGDDVRILFSRNDCLRAWSGAEIIAQLGHR